MNWLKKILACFEKQFTSVYRKDAQPFNKVVDAGDIIFDVCMVLNITICPKLDNNTDDEAILEKQLSAVKGYIKDFNCRKHLSR